MARIPDQMIERLKAEVSVERLVESAGIELKAVGKDLVGRCVWHEDAQASLVITPSKNLWHCFSCQIGGGPIDWMMKAKGVSFRHAVELLREGTVDLPAVTRGRIRVLPAPIRFDADDAALLAETIGYYHERLKQSPEALAYLAKRGINDETMIERFKLGFADRTLGLRLPEKNRKAGGEIRSRLQKLGLWRESGHEHFNGSVVIPIIAASGDITEIYGRKITEGLRPGTPNHLYLPGPHRGVWNESAFAEHKEIILCEALIDALTFWCAGYHNVTASYGIEGFTADHLAAFQSHGTERVLIAYDRDQAGDRAAEKLSSQLNAAGLDAYRIEFPKGMDANEYALKVGPPHKSLGVAIRAAQWLGKGSRQPIRTASADIPVLSVDCVRDPAPVLPLVAEPATLEVPAAIEIALPAQAIPEAPAPMPVAESKTLGQEREQVLVFGARRYRVRGLEKNLSYEILKVNLLASAPALGGGGESSGNAVHVDTFDLYQARARAAFVKSAAIELGVAEEIIKGDVGKVLLALEVEQEKLITAAQQPQAMPVDTMSEQERRAALALLSSADLIERIAADFSRAGIVGERTNALVGYLAAVSRKLDRPLALLLQSSSAAGKSSLMDAVLKFVPEEDRIVYSAMTGQSLFYMGEMDLKHKILAIAEEAGAARASYALKLLQSEGELTIASTSKDAATGKLTTDEYHVEGPVMIFSTTTAAEIDEELKNRCLVLGVDESREQTQAIHAVQRERRTLAGLHAKAEREAILKTHQDAQRLLEPLAVMNPYAHRLTFINDRTRTRRDHEKYLTLIDVIALLHQHQREIKSTAHGATATRYVEVTLDDIALANRLAHEVLGRTLDELPPQTRTLLSLLVGMVERECTAQGTRRVDYRFSRRTVREHMRWGDTQLKIHLARLVELEYLLIHRGGRGQSFEYELLYDGVSDEAPHLSGLIDVEVLRTAPARPTTCDYDAQQSGQNATRSGIGRPLVGPQSGGGRVAERHLNADKASLNDESSAPEPKTHGTGNGTKPPSYPKPPLAAAGLQ
jgi:DNA primase catalytic core